MTEVKAFLRFFLYIATVAMAIIILILTSVVLDVHILLNTFNTERSYIFCGPTTIVILHAQNWSFNEHSVAEQQFYNKGNFSGVSNCDETIFNGDFDVKVQNQNEQSQMCAVDFDDGILNGSDDCVNMPEEFDEQSVEKIAFKHATESYESTSVSKFKFMLLELFNRIKRLINSIKKIHVPEVVRGGNMDVTAKESNYLELEKESTKDAETNETTDDVLQVETGISSSTKVIFMWKLISVCQQQIRVVKKLLYQGVGTIIGIDKSIDDQVLQMKDCGQVNGKPYSYECKQDYFDSVYNEIDEVPGKEIPFDEATAHEDFDSVFYKTNLKDENTSPLYNQTLKTLLQISWLIKLMRFLRDKLAWNNKTSNALPYYFKSMFGNFHNFSQTVYPIVSEPTHAQNDRLKREKFRLASFANYGGNGNSLRLAQNGFYHGPREDPNHTCCIFCGRSHSDWERYSQIEEVHMRLDPGCPFVCQQSDNVPWSQDDTRYGFNVNGHMNERGQLRVQPIDGPVVDLRERTVSLRRQSRRQDFRPGSDLSRTTVRIDHQVGVTTGPAELPSAQARAVVLGIGKCNSCGEHTRLVCQHSSLCQRCKRNCNFCI